MFWIIPQRYTEEENVLLLKIRKRFPNVGQRTLARQIWLADLLGVWKNEVMISSLYERSLQSIYGALRRIDKKEQKKQLDIRLENATY